MEDLVELPVSHVEIELERVAIEDELRQERECLDEFASALSNLLSKLFSTVSIIAQ